MVDRTRIQPTIPRQTRRSGASPAPFAAPDERSMRVLEVGLALVSLAVAILIATLR